MGRSYLPTQQPKRFDVHQTTQRFVEMSFVTTGAQAPHGYNGINSFYDGADHMYLLGYERFRTKGEVESRCLHISGVTQEGKTVSHWFVPFLHDLFSFHDDWQEIDAIITAITVFENYQGAKCFSVLDKRYGTREIGIKKVIGNLLPMYGKPRGAELPSDFITAAQAAVAPDIQKLRAEQLKVTPRCINTGKLLTLDNSRVEYLPPWTFENLLFRFMKVNDISTDQALVESKSENRQMQLHYTIAARWREYHRRQARLVLLYDGVPPGIVGKNNSNRAAPAWS